MHPPSSSPALLGILAATGFAFLINAGPLHASDSSLPSAKPIPRVQVTPLPNYESSFTYLGKELTRFHFDPDSKRPFWYPAQTTLAPSVIRMGHPH
ncbi:MAG: hypothetical protein ACAI34_14070, partial [Verrucomicrobium sp.]